MKTIIKILAVSIVMTFTGCNTRNNLDTEVILGPFTPYSLMPETLNGRVIVVEEKMTSPKGMDSIPQPEQALIPWLSGDPENIPDYAAYYDTTGMILKVVYPDAEGNQSDFWLVKQDSGQYHQADWTTPDSTDLYMTFSYGQNGQPKTLKIYRKGNNDLTETRSITYDQEGRLSGATIENGEGTVQKKVMFNRDEYHHITEVKIYIGNDSLENARKFTYNDNGFIEMMKEFDPAGKIVREVSYNYEYDVMGNWVKRVMNEDGKKYISERTYTYR